MAGSNLNAVRCMKRQPGTRPLRGGERRGRLSDRSLLPREPNKDHDRVLYGDGTLVNIETKTFLCHVMSSLYMYVHTHMYVSIYTYLYACVYTHFNDFSIRKYMIEIKLKIINTILALKLL